MLFLPFRVIYVHTKNYRNTRKEHEMKVNYNATGKERKRLAETIAKEIGVDARYLGAPTFAYQIDYFTVDRNGTLTFDDEFDGDEVKRVFNAIAGAGFTPDEGDEDSGIAIQMPMMTGDEISRLEQLVESKETLLKKAIGTDSLMIGPLKQAQVISLCAIAFGIILYRFSSSHFNISEQDTSDSPESPQANTHQDQ